MSAYLSHGLHRAGRPSQVKPTRPYTVTWDTGLPGPLTARTLTGCLQSWRVPLPRKSQLAPQTR